MKQSTRRKLLLGEAVLGFTLFRVLSFALPFRVFSKLIGKQCSDSRKKLEPLPSVLKDISWAVNRACVVAPWGRKCLINALTAKWLSKQYGVETVYYLGVGRDEHGKLVYHAWLKYDEYVVSGGSADSFYKVLGLFK
ncbi:MAG: lasso peptide biosynthesis B2 protein [Opitutales bacterium]|nr:lasso peptide biosynthesis B2 protein [Opitutales bacterium]